MSYDSASLRQSGKSPNGVEAMPAHEQDIERVYEYIWNYVTENEALPSHEMIVEATGLTPFAVTHAAAMLRKQGRLVGRVFLPTA